VAMTVHYLKTSGAKMPTVYIPPGQEGNCDYFVYTCAIEVSSWLPHNAEEMLCRGRRSVRRFTYCPQQAMTTSSLKIPVLTLKLLCGNGHSLDVSSLFYFCIPALLSLWRWHIFLTLT
jgi:hypothetical protein